MRYKFNKREEKRNKNKHENLNDDLDVCSRGLKHHFIQTKRGEEEKGKPTSVMFLQVFGLFLVKIRMFST